MTAGFTPPPYPYERIQRFADAASRFEGGAVDLSIGTPCDPPPHAVMAALADDVAARGYPASVGTQPMRDAAGEWMARRLGVDVPAGSIAVCVGTKEFVGTLPQWLRLRNPERDTVLYPAVSYPTYAMGATLAGCRAVAVPVDEHWRIDLSAIDPDDAARALCLWLNTPGNPAGGLDDLGAAADWGRAERVPVFSDECYVEFTWEGPPRTILSSGLDGVVAVHSLSKRSNAAGLRVGFYAGDTELVHFLSEVRKHVGMMVAGPVQAAAVAALRDDSHVDAQRERYLERMTFFAKVLVDAGMTADLPGGSFYLWTAVPGGDEWAWTERLAATAGCLTSPGDIYGDAGRGYLRVALVQPLERLELVASRLRGAAPS